MENYYYEYWAKYWDTIDNVMTDTSGVVFASSWTEAVNLIAKYYGDDELFNLEMRATENDTIYEIKGLSKEGDI